MIELAVLQWQYRHLQLADLSICGGRILAEGLAKVAIEVVVQYLASLAGTLAHEQVDGFVGKQPDAYVHKEQVAVHQLSQLLHRGLLKHEVEHLGRLPLGKEHTVVLGQGGVYPKSVAHHIGIGNLLQLACTDINVARCYQSAETGRCGIHDALVQRQLQLQEVLAYALSALPTEYGNGGENLATGRIARQTTALASGMQQDTLLA